MTILTRLVSFLKENPIPTTLMALAGLWLSYSQIPRHSISYDIESITPLLNPEAKETTNLKVIFLGKEMPQINLAEITLSNTGNKSITPGEYSAPISVGVGKKTEILTADFSYLKPIGLMGDLKPSISMDRAHVLVPKVLLNPGDSFRLKLLTSQRPKFTVASRIEDISEITEPNYYLMCLMLFSGMICTSLPGVYGYWLNCQIGKDIERLKSSTNELMSNTNKLMSNIATLINVSPSISTEHEPSQKPKSRLWMPLLMTILMLLYIVGFYMIFTASAKLQNRDITDAHIWFIPPKNQE